jgi:hypothetical protein
MCGTYFEDIDDRYRLGWYEKKLFFLFSKYISKYAALL